MEFSKEYTYMRGFVPHNEFNSYDMGIIEFTEKFEARFLDTALVTVEWGGEGFYVEFKRYEEINAQ